LPLRFAEKKSMMSSPAPRALELHAALFPRADEGVLTGREMAERIGAAFPSAVIDWQRGDEATQARIDQMTHEWRVPEMLIAPVRARLGQVPHITVAFPEWPGFTASLCEYHVARELGDAIDLHTEPFDLAFVHHAAEAVGAALDCDYLLLAEGPGIECRTTRGGVNDALAFAREQFAENAYPGLKADELADWRATVRAAVADYFHWIHWPPLVAKMLEGFASPESYADAVVNELAEIGLVRRIWSITSDAPFQYDLLLDHGAWTTLLEVRVRGMGGPSGAIQV
jgi:hypothetical protein